MWSYKHTEVTSAKPEAIWKRWSNVELWAEQDKDVEWAKLKGPFEVGTKIVLKPKGSGETSTTLTEVTLHKSFTSESNIPFGVLRFAHNLHVNKEGKTEFTHEITITGPLTFVFRKLFADNMSKNLPGMMKKLAELAEKK